MKSRGGCSEVRERIALAAERSARPPDAIRLVLASKTQPTEAIRAAYLAGARDFGENYIQEAASKRVELADLSEATWHLIGHLQSNKTEVWRRAPSTLIQTLDSVRLADAIARVRPSPPMRVLIEVNLGGEASKSGVAAEQVESLIAAARNKVEIVGLMTIPPRFGKRVGGAQIFRGASGASRQACREKRACAKRAFDGNDGGLRSGD